jgi:hypothetical protein
MKLSRVKIKTSKGYVSYFYTAKLSKAEARKWTTSFTIPDYQVVGVLRLEW